MICRFKETLGMKEFPDAFSEIFDSAVHEYAEKGTFFLEESYLKGIQDKMNAFPRVMQETLKQAEEIRKDKASAEYALFLCRAMENRELFLKNIDCVDFPKKYTFFAFLCLVPAMDKMYDGLVARGLPQDVIAATVWQYEECLFVYRDRFDHLGMNRRYFDHLQSYVDSKLLNIGRLRYEMIELEDLFVLENKSTVERHLFLQNGEMNSAGLYADTPPVIQDGKFEAFFEERDEEYVGTPVMKNGRCSKEVKHFSKEEYKLILKPDDSCLIVHIPAREPLTRQLCDESYNRAREIFEKYYPELDVKAFHCHSWMMAPELGEILKPTSNLLEFQREYLKYPVHTKGKDVLNFVFKLKFTSYEDMPEETSLQRALKNMYLSGRYLYEYCGVVPF